jgi:Carboxypeptidase regulatory-like domain
MATPILALATILAVAGCSRRSTVINATIFWDPDRSAVAGEVRDPSSAPIAGATVTLQDTHTPSPGDARRPAPATVAHDILVEQSDANGRFVFEPVPAGDYVVQASANGYEPATLPVTVIVDGDGATTDTTVVSVQLMPVPAPGE